MLHFNQAMILNAGNDHLLQSVPSQLEGARSGLVPQTPTGIYQLVQRNCELHLFPSTCAQFGRREISILCKPSSSRRTNPSAISLEDLGRPSSRLIHILWIRSSRIFEGALGRPPHSSTHCLWIRLRQWRNCIDGRIDILRWRTISGQPLVDDQNNIYKFKALLPKDYYLIPGNGAIKLVVL